VIQIGAVMAVVTLLTIDMYLPGGFNARSDTTSAFTQLFVNPWL